MNVLDDMYPACNPEREWAKLAVLVAQGEG